MLTRLCPFKPANRKRRKIFQLSKASTKENYVPSTKHAHSKRTNLTFVVYYDQNGVQRIGRIRQFVQIANCLCFVMSDCRGVGESRIY